MTHIVLTPEQARIVAAGEEVEVRDEQGRPIAFFTAHPPEIAAALAEAKRRAAKPEPRISSERAQAMLRKFHEIDRKEGMTEEKAQEIVRRVVAGESL